MCRSIIIKQQQKLRSWAILLLLLSWQKRILGLIQHGQTYTFKAPPDVAGPFSPFPPSRPTFISRRFGPAHLHLSTHVSACLYPARRAGPIGRVKMRFFVPSLHCLGGRRRKKYSWLERKWVRLSYAHTQVFSSIFRPDPTGTEPSWFSHWVSSRRRNCKAFWAPDGFFDSDKKERKEVTWDWIEWGRKKEKQEGDFERKKLLKWILGKKSFWTTFSHSLMSLLLHTGK